MDYINKNIKYLRQKQGETALEFGQRINVSAQRVIHYERNTYPPIEVLQRISKEFKITLDQIINQNLTAGYRLATQSSPSTDMPKVDNILGKGNYSSDQARRYMEIVWTLILLEGTNLNQFTRDSLEYKGPVLNNIYRGVRDVSYDNILRLKKAFPEVNTNYVFDPKAGRFIQTDAAKVIRYLKTNVTPKIDRLLEK